MTNFPPNWRPKQDVEYGYENLVVNAWIHKFSGWSSSGNSMEHENIKKTKTKKQVDLSACLLQGNDSPKWASNGCIIWTNALHIRSWKFSFFKHIPNWWIVIFLPLRYHSRKGVQALVGIQNWTKLSFPSRLQSTYLSLYALHVYKTHRSNHLNNNKI